MQLDVADEAEGGAATASGATRPDGSLAPASSLTAALIQRKKKHQRMEMAAAPAPAAASAPSQVEVERESAPPIPESVPDRGIVTPFARPASTAPAAPVPPATPAAAPARPAPTVRPMAEAPMAQAARVAVGTPSSPRGSAPRAIDLSRIHTIQGTASAQARSGARVIGELGLFMTVFLASCAAIVFAYLNAN